MTGMRPTLDDIRFQSTATYSQARLASDADRTDGAGPERCQQRYSPLDRTLPLYHQGFRGAVLYSRVVVRYRVRCPLMMLWTAPSTGI